MTDFDAILKRTLSVVNASYDEALEVVESVVRQLGNAISTNAGGEFVLEMIELNNDISGSVHRIYLDPDSTDDNARLVTITYLQIPSTGFPIKVGRFSKNTGFIASDKNLDTSSDVEEYFSNFLEDPNSKLIQAIGYALRLKSRRL
jgi:hypothetical protein